MSASALVAPTRVQPRFVSSDIPWMLGFSVLLVAFMIPRSRISRAGGALFFVTYAIYVALLLR